MADVFLSYKSEDRALVETLARALEREGVLVWWDRKIAAGGAWRETIVSELRAAKVVIAAWSRRTEDFNEAAWVLNEVDEAARLGKPLIPVLLERCEAPFGYRHVQAADLSNWRGEASHPEWRDVQAGLRAALSGRRVAPIAAQSQAALRPPRQRKSGGWLTPALLSVALAGGAYAWTRQGELPGAGAAEAASAQPASSREIIETPVYELEAEPVRQAAAEPERRRGFGWFGRRAPAPPTNAAAAELVPFVGAGDVRGVFRRTRGDQWMERNSEAGRAGFYRATRIGEHDIELYDETRDLRVRIDLSAGEISIMSRGEDHYHVRYRVAESERFAPTRSRAD